MTLTPIAAALVCLFILPYHCSSFVGIGETWRGPSSTASFVSSLEASRDDASVMVPYSSEGCVPVPHYDGAVSGRYEFIRSSIIGCAAFAAGGLFLRNQPVASAASLSTSSSPPSSGVNIAYLPSVSEAVDAIVNTCNKRYLYNVVSSNYNFLYHGLDPSEAKAPSIRTSQPCDLLNPETYGSEEAASYFADLDKSMTKEKSPVLPSNGHLATTCPKAASEWGVAVSIWPIGEEEVHFAWFADGGLFWPRNDGASQEVIVDGRDCGEIALDDVLVGDNWEVLFRADQGFIAVPLGFEGRLREGLRESFAI